MIRRRFIAGATCPECGAMDKLVRVEDGDTLWMECVACDMRRDLNAPPPVEHPTEVPTGTPVVWKSGK